jgi:C-terminal processing protease CtpA/Prc
MKKILFTILLAFCSTIVFSQWRAVYYQDSISDIKYNLQKDAEFNKYQNLFYFPVDYNKLYIESDWNVGYKILKKSKITIEQDKLKGYVFKVKFEPAIEINEKRAIFFLNTYVRNVEGFDMFIRTEKGKWYKATYQLPFEGYQIPLKSSFSEFVDYNYVDSIPVNKQRLFSKDNRQGVSEFLFFIKEDKKQEPKVIINNFMVYDKKEIAIDYYHPFIHHVLGLKRSWYSDSIIKTPLYLYTNQYIIPEEAYRHNISSPIYFIADSSTIAENEVSLFKQVALKTVDDYPFYIEKNINKDSVKAELINLNNGIADSTSVYVYADTLSKFIRHTFMDPHYKIHIPQRTEKIERLVSPVRLFKINNQYQIAAIFDSTLMNQLSLGDAVVAIDSKSIDEQVDSLRQLQYGTEDRQERALLASILARNKTDSCLLSVAHNNQGQRNVLIKYNGKITIPVNYRSEHCEFKLLDGNIAYFRILGMGGNVYLRFLNHYEEICNSNGLILDLRNNGGGEMIEGMNIFSHFIEHPQVYGNYHTYGNDNTASFVTLPNNNYSFAEKSLPVVIIGNGYTACASEQFIYNMTKLDNVVFLSSDKTAGAFMGMRNLILPSGIVFFVNGMSGKMSLGNSSNIIENKGLEPDIWVPMGKIADLAPYNDILLQKAMRYIKNYKLKF